MIRIHLDILPPTVNEMYRRSKTSFYKSKEATETIDAIQLIMRSQYRNKPIKDSGISVSVNFYVKNARRDIDGVIKSLLDCGNGILWTDDNLITELHIFKLKGNDTIDLIIDDPTNASEIGSLVSGLRSPDDLRASGGTRKGGRYSTSR